MSSGKRLYGIKELLASNGGPIPLSKAGIYNAIAKGDIPTVKIGKRLLIPSWYIDKILLPQYEV